MLNQDVHKNLRRNKGGIRLDEIEKLSENYKRPPGFTLIPNLVGTAKNNPNQHAQRKSSYFDHVQDEMMRYMNLDLSFFSLPLPHTYFVMHTLWEK